MYEILMWAKVFWLYQVTSLHLFRPDPSEGETWGIFLMSLKTIVADPSGRAV
jgi:hypothetical protein